MTPNITTHRPSRGRKVLAASVAAACLFGLGGSFALWSAGEKVETAQTLTAGSVAITQVDKGQWTNPDGTVIGEGHVMAPGQDMYYDATVQVHITGDVMAILEVTQPGGYGAGNLYLSRSAAIDGEPITTSRVFTAADDGALVDVRIHAYLDMNATEDISGVAMRVDDVPVTLTQVTSLPHTLVDNTGREFVIWEGAASPANLGYADFSGQDLSGLPLAGAWMSGANLTGADLTGADLTGVDLTYADLSSATVDGRLVTMGDLEGWGATVNDWTRTGAAHTSNIEGLVGNIQSEYAAGSYGSPLHLHDDIVATYRAEDAGLATPVRLAAMVTGMNYPVGAPIWEGSMVPWAPTDAERFEARITFDGSEVAAGLTPSDERGVFDWVVPEAGTSHTVTYTLEILEQGTDTVLETFPITVTLNVE